ncbi:hypothetical protein A3Q56_02006 [Intoshia linei]|uniref:Kinesin motor domain-containing protein n=1 Tax=Intoshia linei TaxID=1819745 RepID=A0A177B7E1_9BILA|nr:hypothetical protein A3Q56_02006 [Intoshia linei]
MNIEVDAKIYLANKSVNSTFYVKDNSISTQKTGNYTRFSNVYGTKKKVKDVYENTISPLYNMFVGGVNCSLFLFDLPNGHLKATFGDIEYTEEHGPSLKNCTSINLIYEDDSYSIVESAWRKHLNLITESGIPESAFTVFFKFTITIINAQSNLPYVSTFSFIIVRGIEKFVNDKAKLFLTEGPLRSSGIFKMRDMMHFYSLNRQSHSFDNRQTSLTFLLEDILHNNCKTRALFFLNHDENIKYTNAVISLGQTLSNVQTFPIANHPHVQKLEYSYRTRLRKLALNNGALVESNDDGELARLRAHKETTNRRIRNIEDSNLTLKNENYDLIQKFSSISKQYKDMLIQNNDLQVKLSKEFDTSTNLENRNKYTNETLLEKYKQQERNYKNALQNSSNEVVRCNRDLQSLESRESILEKMLDASKKERSELSDNYVLLKSSYISALKQLNDLKSINKELSLKILNFVNKNNLLDNQQTVLQRIEGIDNEYKDLKKSRNEILKNYKNNLTKNPYANLSGNNLYQPIDNEAALHLQDIERKYKDNEYELKRKINKIETNLISETSQNAKLQANLDMLEKKKLDLISENQKMKMAIIDLEKHEHNLNTIYRQKLEKYILDFSNLNQPITQKNFPKWLDQFKLINNKIILELRGQNNAKENCLKSKITKLNGNIDSINCKYNYLLENHNKLKERLIYYEKSNQLNNPNFQSSYEPSLPPTKNNYQLENDFSLEGNLDLKTQNIVLKEELDNYRNYINNKLK